MPQQCSLKVCFKPFSFTVAYWPGAASVTKINLYSNCSSRPPAQTGFCQQRGATHGTCRAVLFIKCYMPWVMMRLAIECKRAYMVPYYNSSICYCHRFEHYFYWIKLMFISVWCFACWLLILHKHFIFIHCSASFTLTWVPKGLGATYAADRVWKWEFYLFNFI